MGSRTRQLALAVRLTAVEPSDKVSRRYGVAGFGTEVYRARQVMLSDNARMVVFLLRNSDRIVSEIQLDVAVVLRAKKS